MSSCLRTLRPPAARVLSRHITSLTKSNPTRRSSGLRSFTTTRVFCNSNNDNNSKASQLADPPRGNEPQNPSRPASGPSADEEPTQKTNESAATYLGTTKRLGEFNLVDRVVIVSGASRGLGLTQAEALLESGATVYALDRASPSPDFYRIQQRAESELGTTLHHRQIDVHDVDGLNATISSIGDEQGRLDGLVAAAGIQQETPALDYTAADANRMFAINVTGAFMTAQATARQMIRFRSRSAAGGGGSIVLIGSMSATVANRGLICPAYNASKAAVVQLARNLASEWGPYGIRVNTISPGYIDTSMTEELFSRLPERRRDWSQQNMLGRLSRPDEYRGAAVFLISEASSFMTGADLRIDGGHAAW